MSDELMTDAELDAYLLKLNDDLIATLNKHLDVEAGLREVFRQAGQPVPRRPRHRRVRLLVRAYWRDALCVAVVLVALAWLALMAFDDPIGWPQ